MAVLTDMEFERGLPASLDAERTILGAILLDNHAYNEAAERIGAEDFAHGAHQRIFARMAELIDNGRQVDLVTLSEELARRKEIESIGGVAYLSSLTEGLPRNLAIDEYVMIVRNKALLRQIILVGSDAVTRAADQSDDALEVLNATEGELLKIADRSIAQGFASIPDIVSGSFGTIDKLFAEGAREITGLATHFDEFDKMTSGLQPSELVIIAARPSMGKTALAINIAQNAAVRGGKVVAVFSLEMSKESLLRRMLASESLVDSQKIQKGFFTSDDQQKLTMALERLVESRMFVDDTPGISLAEMRAKARRLMKQQGGLDLIVIDYMQLMSGTPAGGGKRFENRTQEVSAISRGLKALAKELKIPVIALSQLSRASEQRGGDKKPMLSDLRESGSIEQDADVVAFIHREAYYNRDEDADPEAEGKAEIIIAKQRNGPTGSVQLAYLSKCTRFDNLAYGDAAEY